MPWKKIACLIACLCIASDKPEDFRIADGVLYNIRKSSKWNTILVSRGTFLRFVGATTNGALFQEYEITYPDRRVLRSSDALVSSGNFLGGVPGGNAATVINGKPAEVARGLRCVTNFPASELATGERVNEMMAMPIGVIDQDGTKIRRMDYGLANTPENRKTLRNKKTPTE